MSGFPAGGGAGTCLLPKVGRDTNVEGRHLILAKDPTWRNFLYECLWVRDVVFYVFKYLLYSLAISC